MYFFEYCKFNGFFRYKKQTVLKFRIISRFCQNVKVPLARMRYFCPGVDADGNTRLLRRMPRDVLTACSTYAAAFLNGRKAGSAQMSGTCVSIRAVCLTYGFSDFDSVSPSNRGKTARFSIFSFRFQMLFRHCAENFATTTGGKKCFFSRTKKSFS